MDPITRRPIWKKTKLAAASGGIPWPTTDSIQRSAIWSTTASKKNRRLQRPRRRVQWTLRHDSRSTASWILPPLTTTTIPLKGKVFHS